MYVYVCVCVYMYCMYCIYTKSMCVYMYIDNRILNTLGLSGQLLLQDGSGNVAVSVFV